jgi:sugar-specific transcriptional regulator TrmB
MSDDDDRERAAIGGLERLGLSGYEARTFVALARLGGGTASDVARVSDLPQSRVYGVAESLQERGLVDVQRSTPKRYRPVALDEARSVLRAELDAAEGRAFDAIEELARAAPRDRDEGETMWMVRGAEAVTARVTDLVGGARDRVVFGAARPDQVPAAVAEALDERATAGVRVVAMGDGPTAERYPGPVTVVDTAGGTPAPANAARLVLVDDDGVLVSTVETGSEGGEEVGMWTHGTGLGRMIVGLMDRAVGDALGDVGE